MTSMSFDELLPLIFIGLMLTSAGMDSFANKRLGTN